MDTSGMNKDRGDALGPATGEPSACPACGQMLAATCQVCVACRAPVDFTQVGRPQSEPGMSGVGPEWVLPSLTAPVRFSWGIFFRVLLLWLLAALLTTHLFGVKGAKTILGSAVLLSSLWVFYDAQKKSVPKPLRWGLGTMLFWILFSPWYLSRRRTPQALCRFVEAEAGPVARVFLFILAVFFLLGALLIIFKGRPRGKRE